MSAGRRLAHEASVAVPTTARGRYLGSATAALPLEAVVQVEVVNKPWGPGGFSGGVAVGVTANGAPARALLTVSSRARVQQGCAADYVYLNRRSVHGDLDPLKSQFARVVISAVHPEAIAAQITRALAELE